MSRTGSLVIICFALFSGQIAGVSYATSEEEGGLISDFSRNPAVLNYNIVHDEELGISRTLFQLELLDETSQERGTFITLGMNITKLGSNFPVLNYYTFYLENGLVTFDLTHIDGQQRIYATQVDFSQAYRVDPTTNILRIDLQLEPDSFYVVHLKILGIGGPRNILPPDAQPSIDLYFSTNEPMVGEIRIVPEFSPTNVLFVGFVIGIFVTIYKSRLKPRFM